MNKRKRATLAMVVGGEGFDQPGDSVYFEPRATVSFAATAKKGTTLHLTCGLHPWMQALLRTN